MGALGKRHVPTFAVLLTAVGLALVVPVSKHDFYLIGLLTSSCLWVVYVVCWDILAGYTGMLNFGQMLFAGVAAYTIALIELNANIGRPVTILAGVCSGTCSAILVALPALRVRAAYFALVSFVLPSVFNKITMTFVKVFGGDYGLSVPRVFSRETLYYAAIAIMAVTLISARLLVKSRIGMALECIKGDEETARAVGIKIPRYKFVACIVSAFFTSVAGVCSFYYMGHVGPEIFGMMGSFNVVIMGVVGGPGTIFGAALGGGVLSLILEFMRPVAEYRSLVYAVVLVVVVILAPKGVWGGIASLLRKLRPAKAL